MAMLVMWPGPLEQIFIQSTLGGSIWNVFTIGLLAFEEIQCQNMSNLDQMSRNDLDLLYS